jgi:hypothetical protein
MMYSNLCKITLLVLAVGLTSNCGDEGGGSAFQGSGGTGSGGGGTGITPSEPTGIIAGDGFFVLANPAIPAVIDASGAYTLQESTITAWADDIFDGDSPSGQIIKFKTEWGTFPEGDTCTLDNGFCSVQWRSGAPWSTPPDCRVAITAWTVGEETFADVNGNNLFDVAESLVLDYSEPVLDINSDGLYSAIVSFEGVPEIIDMNIIDGDMSAGGGKDGVFTTADGLYTGTLCALDNTTACTTNTSRVIFDNFDLVIADPATVTVCN